MIRYKEFLIIENKEETKEKILDEKLKRFKFDGNHFYYEGNINNYPQYYEYIKPPFPWNDILRGHWHECSKNLIIERIKQDADYLFNLLQKIN